MSDVIKGIAIPGIHTEFTRFFLESAPEKERNDYHVLDAGAGHGIMTKFLHEGGFAVSACDRFPEIYQYEPIPCDYADFSQSLPYEASTFNAVIAVEVLEHITNYAVFLRECARVLKPGGRVFITTPNILSLKSRFSFLLGGFYYSFQPLDLKRDDGLQHIMGATFDQIRYQAHLAGLDVERFEVDKRQRSSLALLWILPFLSLHDLRKGSGVARQNQLRLLLGRILFLALRKRSV